MITFDLNADNNLTMRIKLQEEILAQILAEAEDSYEEGECNVRSLALGIARLTFAENGIDSDTAKKMAHYMAWLAYHLLHEEEAGNWDVSVHEVLNKIRRSDPVAKREPVPSYGPDVLISF